MKSSKCSKCKEANAIPSAHTSCPSSQFILLQNPEHAHKIPLISKKTKRAILNEPLLESSIPQSHTQTHTDTHTHSHQLPRKQSRSKPNA